MKTINILGIGLIVLGVFALAFLFAASLFMGNRDVSSMVSHEIADVIGGRVEIMSTEWRWFPLPHLRTRGVNIANSIFDAALPQMDIYPRWEVMPFGRFEPRRLYLKDPHIRIKSISGAANAPIPLPAGRIIMKGGILTLEAGSHPGLPESVTLSGLDADIVTGIHEIDIKRFVFVSNFVRGAGIKGRLDPMDGSFAFKLDVKGFTPNKSAFLSRYLLSYLRPASSVKTEADFTIELKGKGLDAFNARLRGDMPFYMMKADGVEIDASSRAFDVSLERRQDGFSLMVNRLEMTRPAFSMTGYLKRKAGSGQEESTWDMDFKAKDVDLSGVRKIVLALLDRYSVTRDVCDIVRGGMASAASYAFHGKTSDFKRLDAMEITADVIKASIHVPRADLYLDEASGPIKIVKGAISGEGLSARMGKSYGTNGGLFFQISGRDDSFRLDLDLDADVSALPPLLIRLVGNQAVKKEFSLVSGVSGRAKGHLNIEGKLLHDPDVRVNVSEMNGSFKYGRLPWPVTIEKGRLSVAPKEISWTDVAGKLGPHRIHAVNGGVNWEKDIFLKIGLFDADVDSQALYTELLNYPVIKDDILSALSGVKGMLAIKNAVFSGPILTPQRWRYQLHLGARKLDIESPDLPAPLNLIRFELDLNEQQAKIAALDGMISDQPISLTANLGHSLFKNWHGSVEMTGIARDGILTWVKARGWIPPEFFPKAPCAIKGLKIDVEPGLVAVKGLISPGAIAGKASPAIAMDIIYTKTRMTVKKLDINDPGGPGEGYGGRAGEECLISLDIDRRPEGAIYLDWQGKLSKSTLDAILEKNTLLSGAISGVFRLDYTPGLSQPWAFDGVMDVSNLSIPWKGPTPLEVQGLRLGSYGPGVNIDSLVLRFGDEVITGAGRLTGVQKGLDINGVLKSEAVSWDNIGKVIEEFLRDRRSSNLTVTGRIGLEIGRFKYTGMRSACKEDWCKKHIYTFRAVKGDVVFLKDNAFEMSIDSADLCGLNTTAKWIKRKGVKGAGGEGTFHVRTPLRGDAAFQEVLPCLDYASDIIEGPFDLDMRLEGTPERWRKGHVKLTSRDGRIRRFTLLAKVFSILNVTDIFSGGLPDLFMQGFVYSDLDMEGDVKDGYLILKKMVINGTGLNIFATGSIDLNSLDSDLTFLIAPFKTIDTIITKVPILGRVLGGKRGSVITIAVGVKGPIGDPDVTFLPAGTVGRGVLGLVTDTLKIPYYLVEPAFVTSPQKKGR
ncbi:MAG: hypothetical protein ACUVQ6_00280 [Dissulfurimicrobium sp.]|uniref:hypothetical protein n=1 Tax=Dissulfurimicrobium sp. TaxID=2022436 RepID=UPI00404B90C9